MKSFLFDVLEFLPFRSVGIIFFIVIDDVPLGYVKYCIVVARREHVISKRRWCSSFDVYLTQITTVHEPTIIYGFQRIGQVDRFKLHVVTKSLVTNGDDSFGYDNSPKS